jgi:hypothetical protein
MGRWKMRIRKPEGKRALGRPRRKWDDNIIKGLRDGIKV